MAINKKMETNKNIEHIFITEKCEEIVHSLRHNGFYWLVAYEMIHNGLLTPNEHHSILKKIHINFDLMKEKGRHIYFSYRLWRIIEQLLLHTIQKGERIRIMSLLYGLQTKVNNQSYPFQEIYDQW